MSGQQGRSGGAVVVTGAAGGIGRATSLILAERGARLVLVDRDAEQLDAVRDEVASLGAEAVAVTADVRSESDVDAYVSRALDAFGSLDGFFNNAGIEGAVAPLGELSLDDWQRVIDVNLTGVFLGLRAVLRVMAEQGSGAIVCTGSLASARGLPLTGAYNAAKHGVLGLVKTAAVEYAARGVRVNAVLPGMVDTRMLHSLTSRFHPEVDEDEGVAAIGASTAPIGRTAEPHEIGLVVAFLLSDDARYVTGAGVPVDGGTLASIGPT